MKEIVLENVGRSGHTAPRTRAPRYRKIVSRHRVEENGGDFVDSV